MLIHIGYHKTGTSWLQQRYFLKNPRLLMVGAPKEVRPWLIAPHPFEFDLGRVLDQYSPRIEAARAEGKVPVLSSERLSGTAHTGGFDSKEIAGRLKAAFPGSRILIVIRKQPDAIVANYKQYVRAGGICTIEEYLHPPADARAPLFRPANFAYHLLAGYYVSLFGDGAVRVLPYEKFVRAPDEFLQDIATFIGIPHDFSPPPTERVKGALSDRTTRVLRLVNRCHGGTTLFPVRPALPRITDGLRNMLFRADAMLASRKSGTFHAAVLPLCGQFKESNRTLQEQFGIDLAAHDYPL